MKKLLIPFVLGAAIGLGATTAVFGYFGDGSGSIVEELAAAIGPAAGTVVSEDAVTEQPDSALSAVDGAGGGEGADAEADLAAVAAELAPVDTREAASEPEAPVAGLPESEAIANAMDSTRLAQMFASMQAREAARVMEHMDDYEVQMILAQLGNREAAAILSNLTPERAAVISRSVIRGERSTQ